jgi:hypothetical protein
LAPLRPIMFEGVRSSTQRKMRVLQVLLVFGLGSTQSIATELQPPLPAHPKSMADCERWGDQIDSYWKSTNIDIAEDLDQRCKLTYAGPNKIEEQQCGNVNAKVQVYRVCDSANRFKQCAQIQKNRGLDKCRESLPATADKTLTKPIVPNKEGPTIPSGRDSSTKLDCYQDTTSCIPACLNAGESDCNKQCFIPNAVNGNFCFRRD